eukprot:TRINITY_DN5696_c0_g2_i3.p1 TRINITY_DN5696_c0_g2~~TRINITY_DN5696_c0_g2_i3.p1  ORF type:complete len:565 (-),score=60.64 TRINITY_DN5696_c0_g2_i3:409-2061(-)
MARLNVLIGLACSVFFFAGVGLRKEDSEDSLSLVSNQSDEHARAIVDNDEHDLAIADSGEHELVSVDSVEQEHASADSNRSGDQELENASPYAIELEHFQMLKDLRKRGFTCPGGKYFPGIPDTESTFKFDCRLWRAAQLWSRKMGEGNFFAHSHGGSNPWDRARAQGYQGVLGENIGAGVSSPEGALNMWKKSDGHCVNMMNADYTDFAVGYAYVPGSGYKHYWTQLVGKDHTGAPLDQSCLTGAPAPLPTPAPRPPWNWGGSGTGGGSSGSGGSGSGGFSGSSGGSGGFSGFGGSSGGSGGFSGLGGSSGNGVQVIGFCFPPSAKVQVDPGIGNLGVERALTELSPGDKLLGQHDELNTYLLDFHADANGREFMPTSYLRIEHELQKTDRPLIITANHLVVVSSRPDGRHVSVPAGLLHPEKHALLVSVSVDGERGAKVVPSLIKSVDTVVLPGFAAPLSSSGTLFVEGVLVSSYALLSDKQLALWQRGPSFLRDHAQLICHILAMPFCWASVAGYGANYLSLLSGFFDGISSSLLLLSSNAASVMPL